MLTRDEVIDILKTCRDPEIDMDIWALGLVYDIAITETSVAVTMTFTTPYCPYGPMLVEEVKGKLGKLPGIQHVDVNVVFEPPWQPSEELRAMLGF